MKNNIKITFFGAAGGVTGSKHLLEIGDKKVLLDCGFFQGRRAESYQANSTLPKKITETDAVILSHAHADHCCSLPLLVKKKYHGPIYTTPATADIARLIMLDAAKIQKGDYQYLKKIGVVDAPLPIYNEKDVELTSRLFTEVPYHFKQKLFAKLSFKFYDAGHILGSAITLVSTGEKNIIYTGDLGNFDLPILPDPEDVTEGAEIMISECTYGNRNHRLAEDAYQKIKDLVINAVNKKSRIIVPAFALGRTQELIYILHKLYKDGEIPEIPIYVDSPLSNSITTVFEKYTNDFDFEAWQDFLKEGNSPFSFRKLHYIRTAEQSKSLNDKPGPLIIIASSGMLEGGRVLHHLQQDIENPASTILLTGYQAENTLGRKLQLGAKKAKIYNQEFDVRARIIKLDELSAHAGQDNLLSYIKRVKNLKTLFLVHGENYAAEALAALLKKEKPELKVIIPKIGESFNV